MASPDSAIPVVDFGRWADGSAEDRKRIARELTEACREVGFVYVVNHGVATDLVDRAFAWSKKLFALPEETKRLAPHPPGPNVHRGYSWPGLEKVSQHIHREGDDAEAEEEALRAVADYKVRSPARACSSCPSSPRATRPFPTRPDVRFAIGVVRDRKRAARAPAQRVAARGRAAGLPRLHDGLLLAVLRHGARPAPGAGRGPRPG